MEERVSSSDMGRCCVQLRGHLREEEEEGKWAEGWKIETLSFPPFSHFNSKL